MLANIIVTILAVLVIAILFGSIYSLFTAIFYFIFSGGDEDRKKRGFNSLRYMVLGLLFTVLLLFVVPFLFGRLGLPGSDLFSVATILARVRVILAYLLQLGGMRGSYVDQTTIVDPGLNGGYYGDYQL